MLKMIKVAENFKGELLLPFNQTPLKANAALMISEKDLAMPSIQLAIDKKILIIMEEKEEEVPIVKKIKLKKKEIKAKINKVKVKKDAIIIKEKQEETSETIMQSWDPEQNTLLDKSDSAKLAMKNINASIQEEVQTKDVDFIEEKKEISSNIKTKKNKKKKISSKKRILKKALKKIKLPKKQKTIQPTGNIKEEKKASDTEADDLMIDIDKKQKKDLFFVDKEQEQQRVLEHPIISRKNNEEVE